MKLAGFVAGWSVVSQLPEPQAERREGVLMRKAVKWMAVV
jgi:hypothetical protein